MKRFRHSVGTRLLTSKLGSLVLLFQRSPVVQMLFPEARLLGSAGLGEATKWVVTSVVGLGAFDTVTGATEIVQTYPDPGEQIVPAFAGAHLSFIFQVVETPSNDKVSWSVSGLPPGLDHQDLSAPSTHLISGTPTEEGSTTVTVTAWEKPNQTGASFTQEFLIDVATPVITSHPASVAVLSGARPTFNVGASGSGITYRWYRGVSGDTSNQVTGTAGAGPTYATTVNHTAGNTPAYYWVRVTQNGVVQNSDTAIVTIATAPAITSHPASRTIPSGTTTTLTVGASGSSPSIQWYIGTPPSTTTPIAGATSTSFTTPALTATTTYWARASNVAGSDNSNAATVTVNADPFQEWRNAQFNTIQLGDPLISGSTADPDSDGIANQDEYIFGTPPLTRDASPLTVALTGGGDLSLGFTARQASGAGYAGKTRHYSLETRSDLASGTWTPLAGFADIIGNNQPVLYSTPTTASRAFYTLRVWLAP